MSVSDLQALFTDLRRNSHESSVSQQNHIASLPATPQNSSGSQILPTSSKLSSSESPSKMANNNHSNTANGTSRATSANAQSLLSLLNFGSSTTSRPISGGNIPQAADRMQSPQSDESTKSKTLSASDLVARLMSPPNVSSESKPNLPLNLEDQGGGGTAGGGSNDEASIRPGLLSDPSQDALRKLLSRASSGHASRSPSLKERTPNPNDISETKQLEQRSHISTGRASLPASSVSQSESPGPVVRSIEPGQETSPSNMARSENQSSEEKKTPFTYTNPFEALNASRNQTPKSSSPAPRADTPLFQFGRPDETKNGEKEEMAQSPIDTSNTAPVRKILTPRLPSVRAGSTLSREATPKSPIPFDVGSKTMVKESPDAATTYSQKTEPFPDIPGGSEAVGNTVDEGQAPDGMMPKDDPNGGAGEWEDVEEPRNQAGEGRQVPVYNFPIKPFVSITLQLGTESPVDIRGDGVMEISRLKKEFDQLDRSLAAATSKYIAYALVKNGGMRLIRQDDGSDRQVFKNSHDRVFNVAFCTTATSALPSDDQAVLGTGVSGSVYYAAISKAGNDLFEKHELESESLIFPPFPPADENSAGGVLKTRAKRSSRHPEFFGIGRGKAIHIVWPATAMSARYGINELARRVDVKKYYDERTLQVVMGKAVKDFVFSEDDSVVASLDKVAKLRFWDIRRLVEESNATAARVVPVSIDVPLLSLATTLETERMWPTSVLFVDKARPYVKGGALRYILVGLRQNHTLQLWDIALGKAVQELNFPHDHETDGLCSVAYHPNSGIIVLGHPTRNSLFFIHLSAPRYTLNASISQAVYIQRIAAKDPELPRPESTACMSGFREISFAEKGQLRSVELLPFHRPADAPKTSDEKTTLFELYVVHSKGVTCLSITKEDLGWNADSRVLHPVDATKEGLLSLKELKVGYLVEETAASKSPENEPQIQSKSAKKKATKKAQQNISDRSEIPQVDLLEATTITTPALTSTNHADLQTATSSTETQSAKENKKNKKKLASNPGLPPTSKSPSRPISPPKIAEPEVSQSTYKDTTDSTMASASLTQAFDEPTGKSDSVSIGISGDWLDKELKKIEKGVSAEFHKELNTLYQHISNDRLVQDSASAARHEGVLRLVASTLTNNVEKSLSRILAGQMQQVVVPATVQAVANALHHIVPHELGTQLPGAIKSAVSNPQMTRSISDTVSQMIGKQMEANLANILDKHVVPSFKSLAISAAENATAEMEGRFKAELRHFETERRHDVDRIEKLSEVLQGMAQTIQAMSDTQVAFQGQILKDRKQLALMGESSAVGNSSQIANPELSPSPAPTSRPTPVKPKTEEEIELEDITNLMNNGNYEEGSIKWLQSPQSVELFDNLFVRFTPEYLATDVSPLVAFSIAITVANSLATNTLRRLEWIAAAFNTVDLQDPEIADLSQHAPALLTSLISKLESMYMTIAEQDPTDPALKMIPAVASKAKYMRDSLVGHNMRTNPGAGFGGHHRPGLIGM